MSHTRTDDGKSLDRWQRPHKMFFFFLKEWFDNLLVYLVSKLLRERADDMEVHSSFKLLPLVVNFTQVLKP